MMQNVNNNNFILMQNRKYKAAKNFIQPQLKDRLTNKTFKTEKLLKHNSIKT
jgi:hypothetical protein